MFGFLLASGLRGNPEESSFQGRKGNQCMTRKFSMWLLVALLVAVVSGSARAQSLEDFTVFPDVVPGGFTALGVVVLNQDAPKGGVVVSLSSNNAAATVPDSVTITARRRFAVGPH